MFAYLLIGLELAILYGVFWYVFVREPKPYNVQGELWGSYTANSERSLQNEFQAEIDNLIFDARMKAIDHLGFERRVPRPAFPTPITLSSAYDPSLYSMPSSHCSPGAHVNVQALNASYKDAKDPRDPYLDYPETSAPQYNSREQNAAPLNMLGRILSQTLGWFENISVKRP